MVHIAGQKGDFQGFGGTSCPLCNPALKGDVTTTSSHGLNLHPMGSSPQAALGQKQGVCAWERGHGVASALRGPWGAGDPRVLPSWPVA